MEQYRFFNDPNNIGIALYYSAVPFEDEEKSALFDVKILWEKLEEVIKEI